MFARLIQSGIARSIAVHELASEDSIRRSLIVTRTHGSKVLEVVAAAHGQWDDVVEIEIAGHWTPTLRTYECTLHSKEKEYLIPHLLRDQPPTRR